MAKNAFEEIRRGAGVHAYQPLYGLEDQDRPDIRPVLHRWAAMEPYVPRKGSALDVGCQNGWFTHKLAERGLVSLGVDSHPRDVRVARYLGDWNDLDGLAFARMEVTPETARALPSFDVVLCLSVFHHLVRFHNLEYATATMRALADNTRDRLFFETGQPNETSMKWAGELAFMGDEPARWVEQFVASLGFPHVQCIAMTPGYRNGEERVLVVGSRSALP